MMRVLLINDCRFESMIMKDILNGLNYDVKITDEYGALNEVKNYSPQIVIANYIMQETTGDKLIKKIKSENPNIKCILSSSNEINNLQTNEYIDFVIHIPVNSENLKHALDELFCSDKNNNMESIFNKLKNKKNFVSDCFVKFCPFCGKPLNENTEGVNFCPYCGHKLNLM